MASWLSIGTKIVFMLIVASPSIDHLTEMMISAGVIKVALRPHFVHDVVLAHVPDHF